MQVQCKAPDFSEHPNLRLLASKYFLSVQYLLQSRGRSFQHKTTMTPQTQVLPSNAVAASAWTAPPTLGTPGGQFEATAQFTKIQGKQQSVYRGHALNPSRLKNPHQGGAAQEYLHAHSRWGWKSHALPEMRLRWGIGGGRASRFLPIDGSNGWRHRHFSQSSSGLRHRWAPREKAKGSGSSRVQSRTQAPWAPASGPPCLPSFAAAASLFVHLNASGFLPPQPSPRSPLFGPPLLLFGGGGY